MVIIVLCLLPLLSLRRIMPFFRTARRVGRVLVFLCPVLFLSVVNLILSRRVLRRLLFDLAILRLFLFFGFFSIIIAVCVRIVEMCGSSSSSFSYDCSYYDNRSSS